MFQKVRGFTVLKRPNLAYCTGGHAVTGGVPMYEKGCIMMMRKLGGFPRGQVNLWELDLRHTLYTCGHLWTLGLRSGDIWGQARLACGEMWR
jgi:hypothetical protein